MANRYIVRALRYIHKSLKQGEQFELVIRDSNGNLVKKYKSRPVAGKLERLISAPFVPEENCQVFYELSPKPMKPSEDSPAASDEAGNP